MVRALSLGLLLAAGCKPEPYRPDAGADAFDPPWWTPTRNEDINWDIQLAKTQFNVTATQRTAYMIELFDAVPAATMLDYGDGMPLMVPAGVHAGVIAQLRATTPPTFVVCHVGTGSVRLSDPDAAKYPGYQPSPPGVNDDPTTPAAGSVIGWSISSTNSDERYIDITSAARDKVLPLIEKRFELAEQIKCDAILANGNDALIRETSTGFAAVGIDGNKSWMAELAARAHKRVLSIGIRNSVPQSTDVDAKEFDWALIERCGEAEECGLQRQFLNEGKAVFALDYNFDDAGGANDPIVVCGHQREEMIHGGIIKSAALDSSTYIRCAP